MTLNEWAASGGNMLSDWTAHYCCQMATSIGATRTLRIRELREMDIEDIFRIRDAGDVAQREIIGFCRRNNTEVRRPDGLPWAPTI